jgi:hypothetical protein
MTYSSTADTHFNNIGMDRVVSELVLLKHRLDAINEPVFLMAGPLLGLIRDKKLIEYDKDIDLGVMKEASMWNILYHLRDFYDEAYCTGTEIHAGLILWLKKYFDGGKFVLPFEFQCHYRQKDLIFYNRRMGTTWKCYETHVEYPAKLFDKFSTVEFAGESFLVPDPPEKWLNTFYGPNWKTPSEYSDWRYNCPILHSGYMSEWEE